MTLRRVPDQDIGQLRRTVAVACRLLGHAGLTENVLGHVSARVDADTMLIRCRGPREHGLLFTSDDDIRLVDLEGQGDLEGGYRVPHEYPIHAELFRARPDVRAVVHAHPRDVVIADLAGLALRPVIGAYDIPAYRMASRGVPTYPRSVLVATAELGRELVAAVGDGDVCVLRGHGIATVGTSVEQAVVRALTLDQLANLTLELARVSASPDVVPPADAAALPDLGNELNDLAVWRHAVARLELAGLADPGPSHA